MDAGLLALHVLCFTMLMGGLTDQALICNLVPILIWKDFSLKWLTNNSIEFIQSTLLAMGHKRDYAEMLQNEAEKIHEDHNRRVPDKMYNLCFTLLGVDFHAARLTLHHAFNQVDVSTQQCLQLCLYLLITKKPDFSISAYCSGPQCCVVGKRCWIG